MKQKNMRRNNIFKAVVIIAIVMALILPSSAMFVDFGSIMNTSDNNSIQSFGDTDDDIKETEVLDTVDWWPMFCHDPAHTGFSTSSAPDSNNILWTYIADDGISSAPAVVDGRVFFCFSGRYNGLGCVNEADGSFLWQFNSGSYAQGTPAVSEGKVVFISSDQYIYCLNVTDGSFIWSYWTEDSNPFSDPMIADGKVFFGLSSPYSSMVCLNLSDGSEIWHCSLLDSIDSSPAVVDGKVFFGCYPGIICLDASDGSEIWSYTVGGYGSTDSSPAVVDRRVFIGVNDKVYCLNATDGSLIWSYTTAGDNVYSSPAVAYGNVYIGSLDKKLYCLDASDGSFIWSYLTGDKIYHSPAVADGKVYIGCMDHNLYCLDASDGSLIWNHIAGYRMGAPSIANGKVFVGCDRDNILYCFGSSNQPPYQPSDPDPYDGETDVDIDADLSWTGGDPDGDIVTYDVYFGTTSPPPQVVDNQSITFYNPSTMDYGTKYYWQIVAWDNHGASTEGPIWDFTTKEDPEIEIEISGGIGVSAVITNTGEEDIVDLEWSINITGGLLGRIDKEVTGIISILAAGAEETVKSGLFFGLGSISITVTAGCAEDTVAGKQFIIFTIIN